jgi:hypothetical protein
MTEELCMPAAIVSATGPRACLAEGVQWLRLQQVHARQDVQQVAVDRPLPPML